MVKQLKNRPQIPLTWQRETTVPAFSTKAFTLIELLVVIALIGILAALVVPALRGPLDGINLTGAASMVDAQFSLARQTAMSRNIPVEARFYKDDGDAWRILALVTPSQDNGTTPDQWVGRAVTLPTGVVFVDTEDYSSLLTADSLNSGTENATAPFNLRDKPYVSFTFEPDGTTDLPSDTPWCLSLKTEQAQEGTGQPAANYVAIVLDSLTGRTILYRP